MADNFGVGHGKDLLAVLINIIDALDGGCKFGIFVLGEDEVSIGLR